MSGGSIRVLWDAADPCDVTITGGISGWTVNGSAVTFPHRVTSSTTFTTPHSGRYTLSVKYRGMEIADTPDATRTVDLNHGEELIFSPSPDDAHGVARGLVGKGELVLNANDYGVLGDTTVQSLTALNDAINSASSFGPVAVYFPRPSGSYYNLAEPFPSVNSLTIRADGIGTVLRWTSGNMLAPTSTLQKFRAEHISCETLGTGHLIELGATGGLIHSSFVHAELRSRSNDSSIIHMNGSGNFFNVHFRDCMLWRQPLATVAAIDLTCSSSGMNSVSFKGGQWHSQDCDTTPFLRAETTSASALVSGFTFEDIVGEQNLGGMIHMYGANRVRLLNVIDFDASSYSDDLFKFATAAAGPASHGVTCDNSGSAITATFAAGKYHLMIQSGGTGHDVGRLPNGTQYGTMLIPNTGRHVRHGGGRSTALRTTTASVNANVADHIIIGNGSSITITLPSPTALLSSGTLPTGREFVVKNINESALTVDTAAGTIDGAATASLAQWESGRFVTDGTNWLRL